MEPAAEHNAEKVVFHARGLTKTCRMGEVEVRALDGVDLDLPTSGTVVCGGKFGVPEIFKNAGGIRPTPCLSAMNGIGSETTTT